MGCSQALSIVGMEKFVEPDIITEVGVVVQLRVPSICCSTAIYVAAKNMDDPVLYLFCHPNKVHILATTSRAFDLLKIYQYAETSLES